MDTSNNRPTVELRKALTCALSLLSFQVFSHQQTLSLNYSADVGFYTVEIDFDGKLVNAVVDTGSSNLNLVGNSQLCPKCKPYFQNIFFTPSSKYHPSGKSFFIVYAFGRGQAKPYRGPVSFGKTQGLPNYVFSVYQQGVNVDNIVGMSYLRMALPLKKPLKPFFDALNDKYQFENQFSLLLCGLQGQSKLFLGQLPNTFKSINKTTLPTLKTTPAYVSVLKDINTGADDAKLVTQGFVALFDSGTTGRIIIPDYYKDKLLLLLRKNPATKSLPPSFWNGDSCIAQNKVDLKTLPTLTLKFQGQKKTLQSIALKPKHYVTQNGCDPGEVHLAFLDHQTFHQKNKTGKVLSRAKPHHAMFVLGTPLLEEYLVTFDKKNRTLELRDNAGLCKK